MLTGAGISAESGLSTFRDSGGLWENYSVYDVATPEGWEANPALVLEFYNQRRRKVAEANPNAAHLALARLEEAFEDLEYIKKKLSEEDLKKIHILLTGSIEEIPFKE